MTRNLLRAFLLIGFFASFVVFAQAQKFEYSDNWGSQGFSIQSQKSNAVELNYSVKEFNLADIEIKREVLKNVEMANVFLPNNEGMPNLPGESKMIAIPEGSHPKLRVLSADVEIIKDVEIAPAPRIPLATEKKMVYKKDEKVYSTNAFFPENPFQMSQVKQLRGVDFVTVGITPFQYNAVTKELKVYKNISLEVVYEGGNGYYGENEYRSRFWDPTLRQMLFNADVLPKVDYSKRISNTKTGEAEYVIITLNNADFLAWADSLAEFRRKQGIVTEVYTLDDIGGNTVAAIESWVDNAYTNWTLKPAAILLLGDYSTGSNGIISHMYSHPSSYPDYASDNKYADVDNDELPEIAFARITANDAAQLEVMVTKTLDYERNPPIDPDFYSHPITALGWQTERWFQICSETIGGFWKNELGKTPVRINAIYSGTPSSTWSTATNTSTVVDYFGPSGLGYIPATPAELGGWSGGTTQDVVDAINNGAFMLQHRDHGSYTGWGEPDFQLNDINLLTNVDNKLPFIWSINCQTGAFHNSGECFAERFHRHTYNGQNSGALGIIAATEVSYSFVNDTYVWGAYDNMWPEFMPDQTTEFPVNFVYPAFGNAAAKHFLYASSWPYNTNNKQVTYRLFHHHGDAFLNVYTEVPQDLTVLNNDVHIFGTTDFTVTADDEATIALTYYDALEEKTVIVATAQSTGGATTLSMTECPAVGTEMLLTVTKQDYFRHTSNVLVISPDGPYCVSDGLLINDGGNNQAEFGESFNMDITVTNVGTLVSEGITATLTTSDAYVTSLTNNTAVAYPNLDPDASSTSSGNFSVVLANDLPDQHTVLFDLAITDNSTKETYNSNISFKVNAPELTIGNLIIDDAAGNGDGILDAGETADIIINAENTGSADVTNIIAAISSTSTDLTINTADFTAASLAAGNSVAATFNVTAGPDVPEGTPADIDFSITAGADDQYTASETKQIVIGFVPEYCPSSGGCDEYINSVVVADINNVSGDCNGGYTDFTDIIGNVNLGGSYDITVNVGNDYSADAVTVWVDWNYNGSFDDAGEEFALNWSAPNATGTIIVPSDIQPRQLMMRVKLVYNGTPEPCGASSYGETEDYTLNVVGGCFGGTASANPMAICGSGTSTLTLANHVGTDIQWQESTNGSTWTDISGATSAEFTTSTLTESCYFRAQVTETGYDPAYSNELMIEVNEAPVAGTAAVNETEICEGETVNLTLTGSTGNIQWQESNNGGSTWSDISGATSATHTTAALNESVSFRAEVSTSGCPEEVSNELDVTVYALPVAGFTFAQNGAEITFTNTSNDAETFSWNFGDGAGTSDDENPVYIYTENGTFSVVLTASNTNCGSDEATEDVVISGISIDELAKFGLEVYPNPTEGVFSINSNLNNVEVSVINYTGKVVYNETINQGKVTVDISNLSAGTYFVRFVTTDNILHTKIVKN